MIQSQEIQKRVRTQLRNIRKIRNPITGIHQVNPSTVENIGKGSCIIVQGEYMVVLNKNRYEEKHKKKSWTWYELELADLQTNEIMYLEYERDDKLELSMWERKLRLGEIGISPGDLENFDDEEEGEFQFAGKTWEYDDSGKLKFFRGNGTKGESYYNWDFYNVDDDDELISVEKWDKYEVGVGQCIDESEVVIVAKGE